MKFTVGEKIRALCWRTNGTKEELTTTILEVKSEKIRVKWKSPTMGFWWIYKDPNTSEEACIGWGKVICKNWMRFEK